MSGRAFAMILLRVEEQLLKMINIANNMENLIVLKYVVDKIIVF